MYDTVKEVSDGNWVAETDDYQKAFRINDRVLFGAVGEFWKTERIDEPFSGVKTPNKLSLFGASELIKRYAIENMNKIAYFPRTYFLVGKEFDGEFRIVSYRFNAERRGFDMDVKSAPTGRHQATMMALPHSLGSPEAKQRYERLLIEAVSAARDTKELQENISSLISVIAENDTDHTVGGEARSFILT